MDGSDIAAIAARLEAAIGEWAELGGLTMRPVGIDGSPAFAPAIMEFYEHAPTDMAALLVALREGVADPHHGPGSA